jgi:class 3 adenylate cyclase/pimeloyl-ACP methyl ester carboxylesterase
VDPATTEYLDREGSALAYQVVGHGAADLVWHLDTIQHLDLSWADPHSHHNFERHTTFARAAVFQRRGVGLSEPVAYVPTLEQQADDVLAVADACGMARPLLIGVFSACAAVAMAAARAPDRVSGLVLVMPFADGVPSEVGRVPIGWDPDDAEDYRRTQQEVLASWGSGQTVALWDPGADTPYNRRLMGLLERSSMTPAAAAAHVRWYRDLDLTPVLRSIQVPTRVLRQATNRIPEAVVRHVADLIDGAEYHELPAVPRGASLGESFAPMVDHVREVLEGPGARSTDLTFGTVLFTDIVGSTDLLARLGDHRYGELRDGHERMVRLTVEDFGGRLLKVIGDGTLSLFDGPVAALRCAHRLSEEAGEHGTPIRAGIHTGDIQRPGGDVAGMTVHVGARIAALAGAGEVYLSQTVRDLTSAAGLGFRLVGERALRGVPGTWPLYALDELATPHDPEVGRPLACPGRTRRPSRRRGARRERSAPSTGRRRGSAACPLGLEPGGPGGRSALSRRPMRWEPLDLTVLSPVLPEEPR